MVILAWTLLGFPEICTLTHWAFFWVIDHFSVTVYLPFYSLGCELLEDNDSVYFRCSIPKPMVPDTWWVFIYAYEFMLTLNE